VDRYNQLIAEWRGLGGGTPRPAAPASPDAGLSVNELLLAYLGHAEAHYCGPDGKPTDELMKMKEAIRPMKDLYGLTPAAQFGPLALRAVREQMVESGLCRTTINARVHRIRRVFRWGVSMETFPVEVYQKLQAVEALEAGRTESPEPPGVKPVDLGHVEATLPHAPRPVVAMVRVQLLTGCRAGEVMVMRPIDLNSAGPVWVYRPHRHKKQYRARDRVIFLGPQAQEVIRPFLKTDLHTYLFSPQDAVADMRARRAIARKSKPTPSEIRRRARRRQRPPCADRYDRRTYRQAVARACDRANAAAVKVRGFDLADQDAPRLVPRWSPLQLWHTAATAIRARFGVEAATVLGHSKVETTEIYAEKNRDRAEQIVREIG
jgi:integrase